MFIKAQSYGQTLHSESKQNSTHTSTKIVWPQRQAKITYTHCDRPQPGLKRRDQLVIQVPASMCVCMPKQFVGDLSANLSQTHYTYAPSEPYCTYAPCDPQRNNGRNEVKWPAEQPVDSALSSPSLSRGQHSLNDGFVLLRSFAGNRLFALIPLAFRTHSECFSPGDDSPAAVEFSCRLSVARFGYGNGNGCGYPEGLRRVWNPVYVAFFEWEQT